MKRLVFLLIFSFITAVYADETAFQKKLKIVIPAYKVEDVSFKEAIDKLRRLSLMHDPEKKGLNIIFLDNKKSNNNKIVEEDLDDDDPFAEADPFADPGFPSGESISERTLSITMDAEKIPVYECIKYICACIDAQYRFDANAIVVSPPGNPPLSDGWSDFKLNERSKELAEKISRLQKELAVIEGIKARSLEKVSPKETLKDNTVIPKVRFDGASLSSIAEFIEKQSAILNKKITVAIYIPADVKLNKINLEANDLPVMELAKYVAEQLNINSSVEKGEICFREKKTLKMTEKKYPFSAAQGNFLGQHGVEGLKNSLIDFGLHFTKNSSLSIDYAKREIILYSSKDNHDKLIKILELTEEK